MRAVKKVFINKLKTVLVFILSVQKQIVWPHPQTGGAVLALGDITISRKDSM